MLISIGKKPFAYKKKSVASERNPLRPNVFEVAGNYSIVPFGLCRLLPITDVQDGKPSDAVNYSESV